MALFHHTKMLLDTISVFIIQIQHMIPAKSLEIYQERINLALDYIDRSIGDEIRLEDIAKAAFFSPYHFHRIFSSIIGETPDDYIRRVRLENAARLLWSYKNLSVTDIAMKCGFSSPALFSRNFKIRFGLTPQDWRKNRTAVSQNFHKFDFKDMKEQKMIPGLRTIELLKTPEKHVAFVRHMKGYYSGIEKSYHKLYNWLSANNLITKDRRFIGISADNPFITTPDKCRYYACYTVPGQLRGSGNISTMTIPGGLYARLEYQGARKSIEKVYFYFYSAWLPQSGLQPDDRIDYMEYAEYPDWNTGNVNISIYISIRVL
jgi:AraC family transcriptional regulator